VQFTRFSPFDNPGGLFPSHGQPFSNPERDGLPTTHSLSPDGLVSTIVAMHEVHVKLRMSLPQNRGEWVS
jgi:hypothetical protein